MKVFIRKNRFKIGIFFSILFILFAIFNVIESRQNINKLTNREIEIKFDSIYGLGDKTIESIKNNKPFQHKEDIEKLPYIDKIKYNKIITNFKTFGLNVRMFYFIVSLIIMIILGLTANLILMKCYIDRLHAKYILSKMTNKIKN